MKQKKITRQQQTQKSSRKLITKPPPSQTPKITKNTKIPKIQDIKKHVNFIIYINVSQYHGSKNENLTFENVV